jgi:hypothetical protein
VTANISEENFLLIFSAANNKRLSASLSVLPHSQRWDADK